MNESKHTPGPWEIRKSGFIMAPDGAGQGDDVYIAEILIGPDSPEVDEAKANARLIAAAPELLAALCEIMDDVDLGIQTVGNINGKNARAAIAKAKGDK